MKKLSVLAILFMAILTSLTGCIIIPLHKQYKIDAADVSSIEIYDLRNKEKYGSGFIETEIPVYTIEEEKIDEFLEDLSDIHFSDTILIVLAPTDPSFYYDEWVAKVNYIDGSYSLISCDGYGEAYDANDQRIDSNHYGCDDEEWKRFIKKYVPFEVFYNEE